MPFHPPKSVQHNKFNRLKLLHSNNTKKIGGERLIFKEKNEHLGLWQCTDIKKTAVTNVRHRLNKTDKKMFAMMGSSFSAAPGLDLDTSKYLYKVNIKPSMTAGLQALYMTNESLGMLEDYEEEIMRAVFDQRQGSSVTPLYFMWGEEPIEAALNKMIFSLYYGMWCDVTSPTVKLSQAIARDKESKGDYWIYMVSKLCVLYDLPPPTSMWNWKCLAKITGKN